MNAALLDLALSPARPHTLQLDDDPLSDVDPCLEHPGQAAAGASQDADCSSIRAADREALYAELQPLVQRLIIRYGKTPELRRDLHGEIYYRFCRLVEEYNPDRGIPLRPYVVCKLQQQVYNYARDHWRAANRMASWDLPDGSERELALGCEEGDPLQQVLTQELYNALPAAISELPHRQRMIILYRFFEGLSFEEIAEQMGVKTASVRSLQRFALDTLRRKMRLRGLISR